MVSGKRPGGRPVLLSFGFSKLGQGPRGGAVCSAVALGLAMLLAGEGVAADSKTPYGMVPYTHPVFHNGVRVLWHGAWRGSQARVGRYERAAPATAVAAAAITPQPPAAKEFSILADPADAEASRMARDFAAVMSSSGAPGRPLVGSTSPNGL